MVSSVKPCVDDKVRQWATGLQSTNEQSASYIMLSEASKEILRRHKISIGHKSLGIISQQILECTLRNRVECLQVVNTANHVFCHFVRIACNRRETKSEPSVTFH